MAKDTKPVVSKEETFDRLEIRLGRVLSAESARGTVKASYRLEIDFGKFGRRTSVARLTKHSPQQLIGAQVLAVLNFEPRPVGDTLSEVLVLGVQFPGAESGEATFVSPQVEAKIGSKLF